MTRRLLVVLALGAVALSSSRAQAQMNTSFSVAGGLASPSGAFRSGTANGYNVDNGYNVAAGMNLGFPLLPVGIRVEGGFNKFNVKGLTAGSSANQSIMTGTVNGTVGLGMPYLIGGVGYYSTKGSATSSGTTTSTDRDNVVGLNGGVGFRFPLGVISTFAEVRYHKMMGSANTTVNKPASNVSYIPITFGINF